MALPKPKGIQLEVLDLKPIGHNVVLGTAGSGKTTLAIYRAIGLANYSPKDNILLITFNTTLVKYLEAIVGSELPPNIHVRNYHKFARGYLASRGKMPRWNGIVSGAKFGSLHPVPCRSVRVQNPHNTRFVKFFSFVSCPLVPSFSLQKL